MNYKFRLGSRKSTLGLAAIAVVTSTIIALFFQYQQNQYVKTLLSDRFLSSAKDIASQLSLSVKTYDIPTIQSLVRNSFVGQNAEYVQIVSTEKGEEITSIYDKTKPGQCSFQRASQKIEYETEHLANIEICYDIEKLKPAGSIHFAIYILILGWFALFGVLVLWQRFERREFNRLLSLIDTINEDKLEELQFVYNSQNQELNLIAKKISSLITRIIDFNQKNSERKKQENIFQISKQVAHDIRSPLSALNLVVATLNHIPEDRRLLIRNAVQRINDIANDLLRKGKDDLVSQETHFSSNSHSASKNEKRIEFIPAIVDMLISEKRIQFRDNSSIDIEIELKNSFGAFAQVIGSELKRVISNLINNAVEAFENKNGSIHVSVQLVKEKQLVEVSICDNGKGIPPEILTKLGEIQLSHGKESSDQSGSGLGVYHAKQIIRSFGGQLMIESTVGKGTMVRIELPLEKAPPWFASQIELTNKSILVSLDDDISIHQIWSGRLQSLGYTYINHTRFQSGEVFAKFVESIENKLSEIVFLVDYELLNQNETGLDLIERLGIAKHAILVTSRSEEAAIQQRASAIGLKLLPKALSGFVPFVVRKPKKKPDYVLVDDDLLVHEIWKMSAQGKNLTALYFESGKSLLSEVDNLETSTRFFIDSNLSNNEKGENLARELFQLGFQNLYLATGYEPENFKHVYWLKGIVGKEPPNFQ